MGLVGLLLVVVYEIIHAKRSNKRKGNMSTCTCFALITLPSTRVAEIAETYYVKLFNAFHNFTYKVIYFENCSLRSAFKSICVVSCPCSCILPVIVVIFHLFYVRDTFI